jgi:hypothetical protein
LGGVVFDQVGEIVGRDEVIDRDDFDFFTEQALLCEVGSELAFGFKFREREVSGAVEAQMVGMGYGAQMSILSAMLLLAAFFGPWACALALRIALE